MFFTGRDKGIKKLESSAVLGGNSIFPIVLPALFHIPYSYIPTPDKKDMESASYRVQP